MKYTSEGEALTDIVLNIFRLNGLLLLEGDQITQEFGLTSARWKVLGAIALAPEPITVPQIARNMGLSRQAVQRLTNEMVTDDLLTFSDNPHHKRAKLLGLTRKGMNIYKKLEDKQRPWASSLAKGLDRKDLQITSTVLRDLIAKID
ncbi:MAG: MarR family transcriptional regulator [Gammaproteobacteria bacterium]|nr:MarR family transcriptional regulator [Gammaproteobacteria bacterium]